MPRGKKLSELCPLCIYLGLAFLYLVFATSLPATAASTNQGETAFVPPGFEALLQKQTTLLDIYYGGNFLVSMLVEYNVNEIELSNPEAVVLALPQILDPDQVRQVLSRPLSTNVALRCYSRGQENCGVLEPEVVGIIFDEDRFRIDLFIQADLLALESSAIPRFLPPSDTGWSFLQNLSSAFAGNDQDVFDSHSLNAASMLARGETRFLVTTNYSNRTDWTADNILLRRDFRGREFQGGYFQTNSDAALRFVPEASLRGLRIASTLDTRTDLDSSTGQELSVFLVNRSRVSIFKEGRLIGSRIYDPGNQVLDTSRLPGGAYPITLRIEDASGRSREEQRFYVKSSRFPPPDQALWGLELGERVLRTTEDFIPDALGDFYGRLTFSKRVTDSLALKSGLAWREDDGVMELGLDKLHPLFDLQASVAGSNDGGYGLAANGRSRWGNVTYTATYRETWADGDVPQVPDQEITDEVTLFDDNVAWFLDDSQQMTGNITWFVGGGTFNLTAQRTRSNTQRKIDEVSMGYSYPLLRSAGHDLYLDMQVSEVNDLRQALVSLNYRWDRGAFSNSAITQYEYRELDAGSNDDVEYSLGTSWRDTERTSGDLNLLARASHRQDYDNASAEIDWRDRFGELNAQSEYVRNSSGEDTTAYLGSFATSFSATTQGVGFGGQEQSRSAIIVEVTGDQATRAWFDIYINGSRRGSTTIGRRTLVSLRPFETYEVELQPRGESFVDFEQRREKVTLYPGNVASLSWDVSEVHVLFGRLLDEQGNAIENAVIRGASGLAMTDSQGNFQAEVKTSVRELSAETRQFNCPFAVPPYQAVSGLGMLGTLECRPEPK